MVVCRAAALAAAMILAACGGGTQVVGTGWNDHFGDGKDRWKTGGASLSVIRPGVEVNARTEVITPDGNSGDRPYAQYAGLGVYRRTDEGRLGVEIGWQGDPLPLFAARRAVHSLTGTNGHEPRDVLDSGPHVNLEGRRTWHLGALAPFIQGSLGTREVSGRIGADLFIGAARAQTTDLATGAAVFGAGDGVTFFVGGDVGYVAHDALLGDAEPEEVVARLRAGVHVGLGRVGIGFSLNWLSPEFEGQPEGQLIGAAQVAYRF